MQDVLTKIYVNILNEKYITRHQEKIQKDISLKSFITCCSSLQKRYTENSKLVFPEKELRGLSPHFHIHVPVIDLYIPRIGLPILLFRWRHFALLSIKLISKWDIHITCVYHLQTQHSKDSPMDDILSSVSDLDTDWNRIQLGLWIWIQEGKNYPKMFFLNFMVLKWKSISWAQDYKSALFDQ